ncbi:hypothetical protein AB0E88_05920 [Streptomyces sp. NPDC028635]|uniref:hypothetical protein n=1 Tax=Streptomyces sp. NPDC028635 TaxID=3154800 RepID=UPI0033F80C30
MKHRGRHRRRRRGAVLRAVLAGTALALTAAATMISASQATVADDPGALQRLTSPTGADAQALAAERVPRGALDRLSTAMGRPVGIDAVLRGADHTLRSADGCSTEEKRALPVAPAATRAYCFPGADTAAWRPGAVAVSGDGTGRVLASAWSRGALAKVAFVDASDPGHLAYTWALLALPVDGGRDYRALASEISGMVWDHDTLLVTAGPRDRSALYAFDVRRALRADVESAAVGRLPGGWSAAGTRFVLPAVASYVRVGGAARTSGLGLDRSGARDALAVSEGVPAGEHRPTRLWRYRLGDDGLPLTDSAGRAVPDAVYTTKATGVRGVLPYGSHWYVARAGGSADDGRGMLWRQDADGARSTACGSDDTHLCWSDPPRSLSYAPATGELWSQSGTTLFAVRLTALDSALR